MLQLTNFAIFAQNHSHTTWNKQTGLYANKTSFTYQKAGWNGAIVCWLLRIFLRKIYFEDRTVSPLCTCKTASIILIYFRYLIEMYYSLRVKIICSRTRLIYNKYLLTYSGAWNVFLLWCICVDIYYSRGDSFLSPKYALHIPFMNVSLVKSNMVLLSFLSWFCWV
jgi:hypothetical protein